jgi:hypothetical protein
MNAIVLSILVDDLEPIQQRAAELGIPIEAPMPMRAGLIGVALLDPNGNKLEFLRTAGI